MMLIRRNGAQPAWPRRDSPRPESFWASYSDLMAGLLMVFALTTVITLLDIGKRLIEPTHAVKEWEKVVEEICHDPDLARLENVRIDCNSGALIISDENLRFGFSTTELGEEAEGVLREAVPKYMSIIYKYPKFLDRVEVIEISGHTDREDASGANPYYSRERAGQVLAFLMKEPSMKPYEGLLKEKAITAGYSDTKCPAECLEGKCDAARRVEICIRLNDREVLREFLNILRQIIGDV
ncbi:OmpA family protein [Desulfatiglans anilini]|uniref:OmpA family protein n=1 Tax=Desulfatiglans anilini TaxID=90728 RepID=UPI0004842697|nr:OmpA family protein [Desulfatiglans anilini]